jgi:hypothetical protein
MVCCELSAQKLVTNSVKDNLTDRFSMLLNNGFVCYNSLFTPEEFRVNQWLV